MTQEAPQGDRSDRSAVLRTALWVVFGIMVATGDWLFLRACATAPWLGFGHDFCPMPVDHRALQREVAIGDGLRRRVHQAEMQIAATPICTPPQPTIDERRRSAEIDRQVAEANGKKGKLQFTLIWHTKDDLDLNLYCLGGTISGYPGHKGPGICGDGVKDLDANREATDSATTNPVENITFQDDIPAGTDRIEVIEYAAHDPTHSNEVPFTLRIRWGDQLRICDGTVAFTPEASATHDAEGAIAGIARDLTWTYVDDLPACDFIADTAHYNRPPK